MDDERPSLTAEGAAVMRALHQQLDGDPKILDDPVAARLVDHSSDFYQSRLELLGLPWPTAAEINIRDAQPFCRRLSGGVAWLWGSASMYCWEQGSIPSPSGSRHGPTRFASSKSIILPPSVGSWRLLKARISATSEP